jgi:Zn-dependent metalloprotease
MEERQASPRRVPARQPQRTIYDAKGTPNIDAIDAMTVARAEGDPPTGDVAVDDAYDGLGAAYDFFSEVFDRDSIDGRGQPIEAVVHYQQNYNNMFWDGQRLVAGDGDGQVFKSFTSDLALVAHEFSIGVINADANFQYLNQPGSLTQSIANVFGVLVKQYTLNQTVDEADWLLGAGVLGPNIKGVALESMAAPGTAYDDPVLGKDQQPAHMDDYVETIQDNGGVHINDGIPNLAFYTTAMALGGYAWEHAGRIWYDALRAPHLKPTTQFRTFARATCAAATRLYGEGSEQVAAVEAGWEKVGVKR